MGEVASLVKSNGRLFIVQNPKPFQKKKTNIYCVVPDGDARNSNFILTHSLIGLCCILLQSTSRCLYKALISRPNVEDIYVLVGSARPERSIPQSRKYILKKAIATRHGEKFYSKGDRNRKNGKDAQKPHFGNKTIQDDDDISGTLCCCYYNRSHM